MEVMISKTKNGYGVLLNGKPCVVHRNESGYERFCEQYARELYLNHQGKARLLLWNGENTTILESK